MSDIALNFHLEWFWIGFAIASLAWVALRARRRQTSHARMRWLLVVLLAPILGAAGGVAIWIAAALLGGWW